MLEKLAADGASQLSASDDGPRAVRTRSAGQLPQRFRKTGVLPRENAADKASKTQEGKIADATRTCGAGQNLGRFARIAAALETSLPRAVSSIFQACAEIRRGKESQRRYRPLQSSARPTRQRRLRPATGATSPLALRSRCVRLGP